MNKKRWIEAPDAELKAAQRRILDTLLYRLAPTTFAHGFVPGRSILTNAAAHVGRRFVVTADIRDFFPSITDARVHDCLAELDLDEAERDRMEREQSAARADLAERAEARRIKRERALLEAEQGVFVEREDRVFLAVVLLLVAFGLGQWALALWNEDPRDEKKLRIVGGATAGVVLVALAAYLTRPGLDEIDRRVAAAMQQGEDGTDGGDTDQPGELARLCRLIPERSRITSAEVQDIEFDWTPEGCVNERTQYGFAGGTWSRIFVPNEEDAVSVNSFDPDRRIFRTERYLLPRSAMSKAREARGKYQAPKCGAENAASQLGELQSEVLGQLPQQANERLVYECSARN